MDGSSLPIAHHKANTIGFGIWLRGVGRSRVTKLLREFRGTNGMPLKAHFETFRTSTFHLFVNFVHGAKTFESTPYNLIPHIGACPSPNGY